MENLFLILNTMLSGLALAGVIYLLTRSRLPKRKIASKAESATQPVAPKSERALDVAVLLRKLEWYFLEASRFVETMERLPANGGQAFVFGESLLEQAGFTPYECEILASMHTRHPVPEVVQMDSLPYEIEVVFNEDTLGTLHEASETVTEPSFFTRVRRLRGKMKYAIYFLRREYKQLEGIELDEAVEI